tara:strand:+ start:447 stop:734 length:288 start_codon:yes stop_codon:yes gene_type:complete
MNQISKSDVKKVATLSRIDIPDNDLETFTSQLKKILDYIEQLNSIDTENINPTTRAVEVVNSFRDDIVEQTNVREDLLDNAPEREGEFYKVPKIL